MVVLVCRPTTGQTVFLLRCYSQFDLALVPNASALLITLIQYSIRHVYVTKGTYTVRVNASNLVTSLATRRDLRVEEPTTGLRVNATHGPIVVLGTSVVVTATVRTGKNLTFDWLVTPRAQKDQEP